MTEHLDKTTITRLAWITELRRQGHRQCDGVYYSGGQACALGLLGEVAGLSRWHPIYRDPDDIGALAGLSAHCTEDVISMNDGIGRRKHTFAEIADVVEGWFR